MTLLSRLSGLFAATSVAVLVLLGVASITAPVLGWQLVAIRGGSMEPAIPYGAVVAVRTLPAGDVAEGDVVTVRTAMGVLVTHRVVGIDESTGARRFILHGDANAHRDPAPVAAGALVGRVDGHVPLVGFLLGMLLTPGGLLAAFAWVGTLILVGMALDEGPATRAAGTRVEPDPQPEPVG